MTTLYTAFRFLLTVYFYTVVSICLIISCAALAVEGTFLFPFLLIKPKLRIVVLGGTHQLLMHLAYSLCRPFWRMKILRPLPSDPWVLGSVLLRYPSIYVVKRSLLKVPIAGWALYMGGTLSVQFTKDKGGWGTKPGSVQDMMKEALRNLAEGVFVVVFPEGTRSVTGRLQPFKNGFFRLAAENPDIHILPIAIHNNFRLWPVTSKLLYPGTTYVAVGDLISAEGLTTEQIRDKAHEAIFDLLKLSPEFNPLTEQPLKEAAGAREHGL